jgi:hypothetical protein
MTRKGQFLSRCKEPHAIISSRVRWRQKECGLRKVGPPSELLHFAIIQAIAINNHRHRIASIRLAGKNIYLGELALHADNSAMVHNSLPEFSLLSA